MLRLSALVLLVLALLSAWTARRAEAHMPPPAYITMEVTDAKTHVHVVLQFRLFQDWFALDPETLSEDGVLAEAHREALEGALAGWLKVRVDGLPVRAALESAPTERFDDHMVTWRYVKLNLAVATRVPPQQVAFAWTRYADSTNYVFDKLDAELDAYGESYYPIFREREPEFIWHRPREIVVRAPPVLPQPAPKPHVTLPVLSLAIVALVLVFVTIRARRLGPLRGTLAVGLGVLLAVPLTGLARVDVPLPGSSQLTRPPDDEAQEVFASLHRSVYAALEGETEDEVYDSLALCVTGKLLPELYLDINASMIMEEEGGAVATIRKTEILASEVLPAEEPEAPWFKVRARWKVVGKVGHWGHTHQRVNEYDANVTVLAADGRWKIADIEVLDEQRMDDGKVRSGR